MRVKRPGFPWYQYTKEMVRDYPDRAVLPQAIVSIPQQRIYLIKRLHLIATYPVSTSRFGSGEVQGSFRTPLGMHYVADKIGADAPLMTQFSARQAKSQLAALNPLSSISNQDVIATRIIWLSGLERQVNQGGYFDSMRRYIYIHGTIDEKRISQPASLGCIRMRNTDVCEVYDILKFNSMVNILR